MELSMSEEVAVRTADNVVTSDNLAEWTANKLGLASEEAPVAAEQETPESEPAVEAQAESEPEAEQEPEAEPEPEPEPEPLDDFWFSRKAVEAGKQTEEQLQAAKAALWDPYCAAGDAEAKTAKAAALGAQMQAWGGLPDDPESASTVAAQALQAAVAALSEEKTEGWEEAVKAKQSELDALLAKQALPGGEREQWSARLQALRNMLMDVSLEEQCAALPAALRQRAGDATRDVAPEDADKLALLGGTRWATRLGDVARLCLLGEPPEGDGEALAEHAAASARALLERIGAFRLASQGYCGMQ